MAEEPAELYPKVNPSYVVTAMCLVVCLVVAAKVRAQEVPSQNQEIVGNQISTPLNQEIAQEAPAKSAVAEGVEPSSVEINGDKVEYMTAENKVVAEGNVEITKGPVKLLADRVEFNRTTNIAIAEGHVILMQGKAQMIGDKMSFNYTTMTGDFYNAKIDSHPYYGTGKQISKVGENHIQMQDGHFTTCDHDKPHYQMVSRKIDIYPGDKLIARSIRMLVGKVPVMFLPKMTQNLNDKKPWITYTPGYSKQWGAFLLTQVRYYLNDDFKGTIHLDYRERKDFASGVDLNYKTKKYGSGIIRTYYTLERDVGASHHFWQERLTPTPEHERFRGEWRHQWEVDDKTSAIWQYSKLSDENFLHDYFKRQQQKDTATPLTYFLLTRTLPAGILSIRTDKRVNRFETMVERLPEISYDLPSTDIAGTGVYLQNKTVFSNLSLKTARPSEDRKETKRLYTDNEISYPMKIAFLELKPFVGNSQTYYSKTRDTAQYGVTRGIFRTGADLSTKFYRVFDVHTNALGLNINRLRHIINPTVAYQYIHKPTLVSSVLDQFDAIDSRTNGHAITFGIENKLQTKRKDKNVDLARALISTDFLLKEDPGKGGFNTINSDIELRPFRWLSLDMDSRYDTIDEELKTLNMDFSIYGPGDNSYLTLGKRWNGRDDDLLISEVGYKINQKWSFVIQNQTQLDSNRTTLQQYSLKRDLHDWIMEVNFNETRGGGSEIWMVFTLKAFPELGFDFGTGFNKRKAGAQE